MDSISVALSAAAQTELDELSEMREPKHSRMYVPALTSIKNICISDNPLDSDRC